MIGVGSDIIEVDRVEGAFNRHGDRFLKRIFTTEERDYCFSMKKPFPHLAARFAAKEAVSKSFTTGIGRHLRWTSVSIYNKSRGQPLVRLDEKGLDLLRKVGATDVLVTLSHTRIYANAVAVLVR